MKLKLFLPVLILAAVVSITGCKESDSKVKAKVEEKMQANMETAGAMVQVTDGVATLTGEVKSENGRIETENIAKGTKGVKSVVNNLTVAAPTVVSLPVEIATDPALTTALRDATKDHPTVTATVVNGKVTLTGTISKADNMILMKKINSISPGNIDNQLTVN